VQAAPAASLRADFNNDGAADLAVGVPFEFVGPIQDAGAVNVLYGSAGGLTGTGSQLFTLDTPGAPGTADPLDSFGGGLATADFDQDGSAGVPFETVGTVPDAGAVSALYGTGSGLTRAGGQLFTQNSPGVGGVAEALDNFGLALAAG
jgi:FG-GAP repeat